jgi:surfactin synthase thioesterase subunit
MSSDTRVLWLSANPALKRFNRPLMKILTGHHQVHEWAFYQSPDEALNLDVAVNLLQDYLGNSLSNSLGSEHDAPMLSPINSPVHLIGHSTSGLIGLLYAWQYPQYVRSLTLLSVGINLTLDWQAHYYAQAQFLRCSRSMLLAQMAYNLFGLQSRGTTLALVNLLEQDLLTSPSPHTLSYHHQIAPAEVPVPVLVCGGESDIIIEPRLLEGWQPWLQTSPSSQQPADRIWLCPNGGHFFHSEHPELVSAQIQSFWTAVESVNGSLLRHPSRQPEGSNSVLMNG